MGAIPFVYRHRVRYHECDAQGIVFNANYVTYLDVALTELFRATIGTIGEVVAQGYDNMVVDVHVAWRSPARFDDELAVALTIARFGRTSMTTHFTQSVGERLCAEGEIVHVWVDAETHRPIAVPQFAIDALVPHTAPV